MIVSSRTVVPVTLRTGLDKDDILVTALKRQLFLVTLDYLRSYVSKGLSVVDSAGWFFFWQIYGSAYIGRF